MANNASVLSAFFAAQNRLMNSSDPLGQEKAVSVYLELLKHPATFRRASFELGQFCINKRNHDTGMYYLSRGALGFEPNMHIAGVDCAVLIASTLLSKECTYRSDARKQNRAVAIETLKLVKHAEESMLDYDGRFLSYKAAALSNGVDLANEPDPDFEEGPQGIHKMRERTVYLKPDAEMLVRFLSTQSRLRDVRTHTLGTVEALISNVDADYMSQLVNDF